MHPMILITSASDGLVYLNGVFLGEIRQDTPVLRPVTPFGSVALEFRPFQPMSLSSVIRIVFSKGRPVFDSLDPGSGASIIAWPFGITEIRLPTLLIHTLSPVVKTLTGAGRTFRYIKAPSFAFLETEFQGRISAHALPSGAGEPVFAEGDGVLYVSGDTDSENRYALVLTQTGEHLLFSCQGKSVSFLPGGRIRVVTPAGDLAGHETEEIYIRKEMHFERESREILMNPAGEFRAVTPAECALCAAEALLYGFGDEINRYVSSAFEPDNELKQIIARSSSASFLRFTPPDGRSAVAYLQTLSPVLTEGTPIYYRAEMREGSWKIIDLKAW